MITLTPQRPNGAIDYGPSRIATLDRNIAAVQQAVEREAAQGHFDLLATLAAAVKATPPLAMLIVISSGLSTAGGFDLRQVGWGRHPPHSRGPAEDPRATARPGLLPGHILRAG